MPNSTSYNKEVNGTLLTFPFSKVSLFVDVPDFEVDDIYSTTFSPDAVGIQLLQETNSTKLLMP